MSFHVQKKLTTIPEWARGSVGYQIYIDSFRNGDVDNDAIFNEFGTDDFSEPTGEIRSGRSKKRFSFGILGWKWEAAVLAKWVE